MRKHPEVGRRMIAGIPYLEPAAPIVLHHHERWDGKGYPHGLGGEAIPLEARLLAIVDTFDAMTTDRPYRPALPASSAFETLLDNAGTQFDPDIVHAFVRCWERGEIQKVLTQQPKAA
jgi:putative two-component system response regulator